MSTQGKAIRAAIRSLKFVALTAVASLVLAGCAMSFPHSGDVHSVSPQQSANSTLGLAARPPARDASAKQIVEGFLEATSAGFDDNFLVARQYLGGDVARTWSPLGRVQVYAEVHAPQLDTASNGAIKMSVGAVASLSDVGMYAQASANSTVSTQFSLMKNADGQWRIVDLEDGIFLPEHLFDELYVPGPVYYLTRDKASLVPDIRYFPRRTFVNQAVNALLAGPAPWLAPAVTTAIPADTRLASSVEVTSGRASVNLSSAALSASPSDQALMYAQISRTLSSLPSVHSVAMLVEGASMGETAKAEDLPMYPYEASQLSGIVDGQIGTFTPVTDGEASARFEPVVPTRVDADAATLAVGYKAEAPVYAAVGDSRQHLWFATKDMAAIVYSGTEIAAPSIDSKDDVWFADAENAGEVLVYSPRFGVRHLQASWLKGISVRGFAISREGARGVVWGVQQGTTVAYMFSVVREASGDPVAVSEPLHVVQGLAVINDIAWISSTDLVVLGARSTAEELGLFQVGVTGPVNAVTAPTGQLAQVSAGRDVTSVVVLSREGEVMTHNGGAWQHIPFGASAVAFPG